MWHLGKVAFGIGFILWSTGGVFGQTDSLWKVAKAESNDSIAVEILISYTTDTRGKPDSYYSDMANLVKEGIDRPAFYGVYHFFSGSHLMNHGNTDSAVGHFNKVLWAAQLNKDSYPLLLGLTNGSHAYSLYQQGRFEEAGEAMIASVAHLERSSRPKLALIYKANLGAMYYASRDFKKLIESIYLLLEQREDLSEHMIQDAHFNLSLSYYMLGNAERTVGILDSILPGQKVISKELYSRSFVLRGMAHAMLKSMDLAQRDYEKGLEVLPEKDLSLTHADIFTELADLALSLGHTADADSFSLLALKSIKQYGTAAHYNYAYEQRARLHEQIGAFDSALYYVRKQHAAHDSILNARTKIQIEELNLRYETAEREREIELLKREEIAKSFRFKLILVSLLALLVVISLVARQKIRKVREAKAKAQYEAKRMSLEYENQSLKREKLEQEVAQNQKRITTEAVKLSERNDLLSQTILQIDEIVASTETERAEKLHKLKRFLKRSLDDESFWDNFKKAIMESDPKFMEQLAAMEHELSHREMRLLYLSKLGLTITECSQILHIAPKSVKMARYRLKQKLGLDTDTTLEQFVSEL